MNPDSLDVFHERARRSMFINPFSQASILSRSICAGAYMEMRQPRACVRERKIENARSRGEW